MVRDHRELICWQRSDELRQLIIEHTKDGINIARGSLGEVKDGIQDGLERGFWPEEVADQMFSLCKRAMKANLNWLKALKRRDPKRERGASGATGPTGPQGT